MRILEMQYFKKEVIPVYRRGEERKGEEAGRQKASKEASKQERKKRRKKTKKIKRKEGKIPFDLFIMFLFIVA